MEISVSLEGCVCMCPVTSDTETPWTVARQAPLSIEFSRQEYSNGLPFLPPGDLPDPGIKLTSPESPAGACFATELPGTPRQG